MHLIHILGASGSGTTTLGQAISDNWRYLHLDTDDYFWLPTEPPFTVKREVAQRQALLAEALAKADKCVLTGSLCGWGDFLLPSFSLVIYLQTPTELRIRRLQEREAARFGDRILQGGDMYQNHLEFIAWAKTYDTAGIDSRSKALHEQWLRQMGCPVLVLDGTKNPAEHLEQIGRTLSV